MSCLPPLYHQKRLRLFASPAARLQRPRPPLEARAACDAGTGPRVPDVRNARLSFRIETENGVRLQGPPRDRVDRVAAFVDEEPFGVRCDEPRFLT
jgi:hypothetical protein